MIFERKLKHKIYNLHFVIYVKYGDETKYILKQVMDKVLKYLSFLR